MLTPEQKRDEYEDNLEYKVYRLEWKRLDNSEADHSDLRLLEPLGKNKVQFRHRFHAFRILARETNLALTRFQRETDRRVRGIIERKEALKREEARPSEAELLESHDETANGVNCDLIARD